LSHIGEKGKCSRCYQEKIIKAEFSAFGSSDKNIFYCEDCFDAMNTCICEFCAQKLDLSSYNNHLLNNHTKEEMAAMFSQHMIDSKKSQVSY
jgi:hypothetical protein